MTEDAAGAGRSLADLAHGPEARHAEVRPEDIAWLPYTSGTTGDPKGVMLSHRCLMACMRNLMVELPAIETHDVVLHVAPLSHLSGYLGLTYAARGAAQTTLQEFDARATLEAIAARGATVLPLVPTMINLMLPEVETGRYDVRSIHTILYGGSAIAPDRLARAIKAFGNVFVQGYYIVDPKKDMIVSGGFNIFPSEVENAISTLAGVHEVAVVGVPDARWGETVRAVIVADADAALDEATVQAHCCSVMASYKKPQSVVFVEELPKTGSGKIMRRRLRDTYWADHGRRVGLTRLAIGWAPRPPAAPRDTESLKVDIIRHGGARPRRLRYAAVSSGVGSVHDACPREQGW